jgi:beta-ureidopropionase / N-carbamoyl-L-amino-acid hydrolase
MITTTSFSTAFRALEDVGRASSGGYRRFAWTPQDRLLREWFAGEAAARGLDLVSDRAGNQVAWWGDPDATPGVVTGSHLDSVPDGGAYDGPLGVVSAFAALDVLRAEGFAPSRPLGVAHFGDEEGARFGIACTGSRMLTGVLDPAPLRDGDGIPLVEAAARAGYRDLGPDPAALRRIGTFVELHVEQGRALADLGRPVAVGTAINPHGRWRIDLAGRADHAGTTRLADRDDPMLALARIVLAARAAAERHDAVATVGKLRVEPNGVNAIPSHVTAWLDARGADAERVRAVVADVATCGGALREESWTDRTTFDPPLAARLATLLDDAPLLASGAGHDAGILAAAGIPTAMLYVRNPTGVSHSPEEHASDEDCAAGAAALATVLRELL